ncbi:TetR/AcrR family transcriptional regulator [Adhaeribacter aquaticus]|uniref:TetR/AcrR family transcriptional regulator n=1 Tax=Adhaeribacter aquaticus TaxID=299567 RepID=UPI0003F97E38|nr:hypothetical protein [Adhaeribacter aquaticus]
MVLAGREALFRKAMSYFYKNGVKSISGKKICEDFDLSEEDFKIHFKNKEGFLRQAVEFDLEDQKNQEKEVLVNTDNAVEEIIKILRHYTLKIANIHPSYFIQIQYLYPEVWQTYLRHAQMYGYYLFYDLISKGIDQQLLRRDLNIEIVTKVLIEQINVMHNTHLFPKHRYNMGEVFRSIYLFYLRGICTEKGLHKADQLFVHNIFD